MSARVRVLVVDDSATMRGLIGAMLRQDTQIEVVGEAADATEARRAIKELDPDVITLDIEMPGMDGLEFLEKIMTLRPMPVVIVSSLTQRAATITLRALEAGAFDCFAKPASAAELDLDGLARLVRAASRCPVRSVKTRRRSISGRDRRASLGIAGGDARVVAIGSSTGGVEALLQVIGDFPEDCPPTVIVQHMPALFTTSFAERLDRFCPPHVEEARTGTILQRGHVYLAPGGNRHMEVIGAAAPRIRLREGGTVSGHRPSVDVLFSSVARLGVPSVGVILTGMGADGASGLRDMRAAGARTIGQDAASCVVYGMPQVAFEIGAVGRQLPLPQIAAAVMEARA